MKITELLESKNDSAAIAALKDGLIAAKKRGEKMDYDGVAVVMEKVWNKYRMTGQKLHDVFVKELGVTPDTWIKKQKNIDEDGKYLGPTEKVGNISPVLKGPYGKKQKKLMNKFFGSS